MSEISHNKKKPKILVISSTYPRWLNDPEPGFVHELSKRFADNFHVTVLCPHAPGAKRAETLEGVEIRRFRYAPERLQTLVQDGGILGNLSRAPWKFALVPLFALTQLMAVMHLFRKLRPDVVHAHWLVPQGFVVCLANILTGSAVPFVVTSHGADLFSLNSPILKKIKKWVLGRASAITVVSRSMKEELKNLLGDDRAVSVLPMGVNLEERFIPDSTAVRNPSKLLFVGRLVEKKGLRVLLEALPLVIEECPDVTLDIIGFGPLTSDLKALSCRYNLSRKVNFLGPVPQTELPAYYQACGVFVAPFIRAESGDEEGLGLVVVEALGCGCRAVVSDMRATRDVFRVIDGVVSVEPGNIERLARAIIDCIVAQEDSSPDRTELLERFGWRRVSRSYSALLGEVAREAK